MVMRRAVLLGILCLLPGAAWAGGAAADDRLEVTVHDGSRGPAQDVRLDADLVAPTAGRMAPFVGVEGASLPEPDRSAGIPTDEVTRLDVRARAGLRLNTGHAANVRLFVTLAGASLDAEDHLGARSGAALDDFGLAFTLPF